MMRNKDTLPELLSPAGSFESLVAAVNAGADAVYMGGPLFGARAYADNPEGDTLFAALDYAHLAGRKVYLTVNTLLKEDELRGRLFDYMEPIVRHGLDGVIVQDLGVLSFLREAFPGLGLHASTQMAVSGPEGARLLEKMGVRRLVLPRELSIEEIRAIGEESGVETEVFVHGALCYCYSGRCLMSSFLGGRSGNRGRCAQPCRLPYEQGRLMNMRDLCGLDELSALWQAGVSSLKIEGRMKSPEYTAGVTAIYRKYLDLLAEGSFRVEKKDRERLSALFDRGGFTEGYYRRHNGADMLDTGPKKTHVSLSEEERRRLAGDYLGKKPFGIRGSLTCLPGKPLVLSLEKDGITAQAKGETVQKAREKGMTAEALRRPVEKTGGSDFVFLELSIETDGMAFVPVSALNALRREGLTLLKEKLLGQDPPLLRRPEDTTSPAAGPRKEEEYPRVEISVLADDPALGKMLLNKPIARLILPADYVPPSELKGWVQAAHEAGKQLYYALPQVFRRAMREDLGRREALELIRDSGLDGVLLPSWEALGFWLEQKLPGERMLDASLYVWNRRAQEEWIRLGAQALTLPLELHEKDLARLGGAPVPREQLIYGRAPLMLSAQCLFKTTGQCLSQALRPALGGPVFLPLKDRTGAQHPCEARCRYCYSLLYNAVPSYTADLPLYADRLRLHFTNESEKEAEKILDHVAKGLKKASSQALKLREDFSFTRGNYRKGVE